MAEKNGVESRVLVRGFCNAKTLSEAIEDSKKCLVVMDIEGGERELLDNQKIPKLDQCHILVESHDRVCPGVGELIKERFKGHKITEIWQDDRTLKDFPLPLPWLYTGLLKKYFVLDAMDEGRQDKLAGDRSKMRWLYIEPAA